MRLPGAARRRSGMAVEFSFRLLSTFPINPARPTPLQLTPGLLEKRRRKQLRRRGESCPRIASCLLSDPIQLCGHGVSSPRIRAMFPRLSFRLPCPPPPVRSLPALRIPGASPTSMRASILLAAQSISPDIIALAVKIGKALSASCCFRLQMYRPLRARRILRFPRQCREATIASRDKIPLGLRMSLSEGSTTPPAFRPLGGSAYG